MKKIIVVLAFLCLGFIYRGVNEEVVPIDDTCVLYLDMESINGTEVHDLSQSHNNGTITTATRTVDQYGQYLSFDGTNDYVDCGTDTSLNFTTSAFSICAWIYTTPDGNSRRIFERRGSSTDGYSLRTDSVEGVYLTTYQVGTAQISSALKVSNNVWTFIVATRSGAAGKIYKNGVNATSTSGTHINPVTSTGNAYIGIDYVLSAHLAFSGKIDDVRIFSRALTAQEIIDLYESTRGRYGI